MILAICAFVPLFPLYADAVPAHSHFSQCLDFLFYATLAGKGDIPQPGVSPAKIGSIIEGRNLIWGESVGWVNLRTRNADIKIGSNILAGWIWIENCGWVCIGEGHPLNGERYSNRGSSDWGVNNDGKGNLSGYAWSEVTGWINFRTGHSQVYLSESGQFCGYAWGENVGWMHFGPGRTVHYLAKVDPGPWREIGSEPGGRLAGSQNNSEMSSSSVPVAGLKNNHERYNKDIRTVCSLTLGRYDSCARIRCSDAPVHISSLARANSIRAPPVIA